MLGNRKTMGAARDAELIAEKVMEHRLETTMILNRYKGDVAQVEREAAAAHAKGDMRQLARLLKRKRAIELKMEPIQRDQEMMQDVKMDVEALKSTDLTMSVLNVSNRMYARAERSVNPARAGQVQREMGQRRARVVAGMRAVHDGQDELHEQMLADDLDDDGGDDEEDILARYLEEKALADSLPASGGGGSGSGVAVSGAAQSAASSAARESLLDRLDSLDLAARSTRAASAPPESS